MIALRYLQMARSWFYLSFLDHYSTLSAGIQEGAYLKFPRSVVIFRFLCFDGELFCFTEFLAHNAMSFLYTKLSCLQSFTSLAPPSGTGC